MNLEYSSKLIHPVQNGRGAPDTRSPTPPAPAAANAVARPRPMRLLWETFDVMGLAAKLPLVPATVTPRGPTLEPMSMLTFM